MLVIFLILFTKILADSSDEDKYVDLLPDEEKQQFIEKVARRILQDVESQENGTHQSGELSDEQLKKHNDYVKAILKEESENVRRSKNEALKDKDEKPVSDEHLDVKPLETEKIADDPDLEQVDLTLRNDRRDITGSGEKSSDYIKVEIITENAPIIKRSVQNESEDSDSESEEHTKKLSQKLKSTTEGSQAETIIKTSENENTSTTDKNLVESTAEGTTLVQNVTKNESTENIKPIVRATGPEESEIEKPIVNNTESIESTTSTSTQKEIEHVQSIRNYSIETDVENIQARGLSNAKTRRTNSDSMESMKKTTLGNFLNPAVRYFGPSNTEDNSDEHDSVRMADTEELHTANNSLETTTAEKTAPFVDKGEFTTTVINSSVQHTEKKHIDTTGTYIENTLTSTLTDEGTTSLNINNSTYKISTDNLRTHNNESFTEDSLKNNTTTTEMPIIVEDFTSAPTLDTSINPITTFKTLTSLVANAETTKIKLRAEDSEETGSSTTKVSIESTQGYRETTTKKNIPKLKEHKVEISTETPIKSSTVSEKTIQDIKAKVKDNISNSADKNFIELEKVYYNKIHKKGGKEYHVYEIPANKAPFIQNSEPITEQPYYVPIYNYSPNLAYYNPQNRLGPNADDDSKEQISPFSIVDDVNNIAVEDQDIKEYLDAPEFNADYPDTTFNNQRKKFGSKMTLSHNIHKSPQQSNEPYKKSGKLNPEDYLDSDYYFGRVRKDLERREYESNPELFPNSNDVEHPAHSIQEMNLKDHVRAVRNILFRQKYFGPAPTHNEYDLERLRKNVPTLTTTENIIHRNGDNKKNKKHNIAIDYYFGRMQLTTATPKYKEVNNEHFKKVGYVKDKNDTKELYMIDKFFKQNVVRYINELNSKDNTYVKADIKPATPMPHSNKHPLKPLSQSGKETKLPILPIQELKNKPNSRVQRFHDKVNNRVLKQSKSPTKVDTIHNVLKITDEKDVFGNSEKMQKLHFKMNRRNDDVKVNVYLGVLKDMISSDNKGLKQYDWLSTTVDIQSSLQKLYELIDLTRNGEDIHPDDVQILKYCVFLHKIAAEILEANAFGAQLRKKLLPKNKKKKEKHRLLKEKGLLNRVWLYLRRQVPELDEKAALNNFDRFLMDVEDGLFDLHDAIKNVAKVTKYRNQHWFQNLKELYLNTDDKHLLDLLLHMTVSRLYGLIEESAKNGLEDDYLEYMKKNKKEAKRTLEEMLFVMQILDEINKNVE